MSFSPFNEGPSSVRVVASMGLDTSAIDAFRQGVEIPVGFSRRFLGVAPKMGSGNEDHSLIISNFGFSIGFDDRYSGSPFSDNERFDPISYLAGEQNQTYQIFLNDRVSAWLDAVLQPLTIPFRTMESLTEVPFSAHRITGIVMPIIDQAQSIDIPLGRSAFTDSDAYSFGNVRIEGISGEAEHKIYPFDDSIHTPVLDECNVSELMLIPLRNMQYNLNGDLRNFRSHSMTAGFVFGQHNANVGTDSIAFGDRKK